MRLYEMVLSEQQLDEINLKRAIAAGSLALATAGSPAPTTQKPQEPTPAVSQTYQKGEVSAKQEDPEISKLVDIVTSKYNVDSELAKKIVTLAKKYEKPIFPKAEDLLAIIGIESSFNPQAVSGLKSDPAVGLTQIRPGVWGLDANELKGDIEQQIAAASDILSKYSSRLKNIEDTVHAYNVGLRAFRRGDLNPKYVTKFKNEKDLYI